MRYIIITTSKSRRWGEENQFKHNFRATYLCTKCSRIKIVIESSETCLRRNISICMFDSFTSLYGMQLHSNKSADKCKGVLHLTIYFFFWNLSWTDRVAIHYLVALMSVVPRYLQYKTKKYYSWSINQWNMNGILTTTMFYRYSGRRGTE